jgi:nucleotide-binding universal stress UspA family protein
MTIVHPTDFSEQSSRAGAVALALARRLRASIALLHVVEPPPIGETAPSRAPIEERLERLALQMRASGVEVEPRLVEGYAEDAIAAESRTLSASLIVIGTHSRRPPLRWLLGSVAERILKSAEVPVLVVPDSSAAFEAWGLETRRLNVVVGLESARPPDSIVEIAGLLQATGSCEILFVHVAAAALLESRVHGQLARAMRDRLRAFESEGGGSLQMIASRGSVAESLGAFLATHPCDLAVVGVHPRLGFESQRTAEVARALLRMRIAPVLAVPLPTEPLASLALPPLHSILAATDLSELGNRAVPYAYALAGATFGVVTILHVLETLDDALPVSGAFRSDVELRLLSLVPHEPTSARALTNVIVIDGPDPAQTIVDTATRLDADVICMGSRGRTAVGHMILGSVAERVVHHFGKAVLLVR